MNVTIPRLLKPHRNDFWSKLSFLPYCPFCRIPMPASGVRVKEILGNWAWGRRRFTCGQCGIVHERPALFYLGRTLGK